MNTQATISSDDQAQEEPASKASSAKVSARASRRTAKSASAFRTISEVAKLLDVQQHVLRFWETKFSQVKPMKRGGGRRYYRPEDVNLLKAIHDLLYTQGYTIKGVQKLLKEHGKNEMVKAYLDAHAEVEQGSAVSSNQSQQMCAEGNVGENVQASMTAAASSSTTEKTRTLHPQTVEALEFMLEELKALRNLVA